MKKKLIIPFLSLVFVFLLSGCGQKETTSHLKNTDEKANRKQGKEESKFADLCDYFPKELSLLPSQKGSSCFILS